MPGRSEQQAEPVIISVYNGTYTLESAPAGTRVEILNYDGPNYDFPDQADIIVLNNKSGGVRDG